MDADRAALRPEDFAKAAARLRCDIAAIRAVAKVEAPKGAFLPTGEPTLLFERHIFDDLTRGAHTGARAPGLPAKYSLISSPVPSDKGEYGPESAQHARLQAAVALNRDAALKSASWGMFQILGKYFDHCGFTSVQAFVTAMYSGAAAHLEAFVSLVLFRRLDDELREHRWADFARRYNGSGYRRNRYDEKLAEAFALFQEESAHGR